MGDSFAVLIGSHLIADSVTTPTASCDGGRVKPTNRNPNERTLNRYN